MRKKGRKGGMKGGWKEGRNDRDFGLDAFRRSTVVVVSALTAHQTHLKERPRSTRNISTVRTRSVVAKKMTAKGRKERSFRYLVFYGAIGLIPALGYVKVLNERGIKGD